MRKPSASMIVALIALFVALTGVGVAANGGSFILGHANSATLSTSLSSAVAGGKALQLTNSNTTNAASTALGLNVASGHAPFTVNSGTKVANLNADKLDGIDSTGFVQGRGTLLANRMVFVPTSLKNLLTIPGLGHLTALCEPTYVQVVWSNNTGGNVDVWTDFGNPHFDGSVAANSDFRQVVISSNGVNGGTLSLGVGNDPNARRTAVLHVFAYQSGNGAPCGFQVQGTMWTSQ